MWLFTGLFDAIHVGAAAPGIPEALIHQLASPGRMFIPVGGDGEAQQIVLVDKDENEEITQTPQSLQGPRPRLHLQLIRQS